MNIRDYFPSIISFEPLLTDTDVSVRPIITAVFNIDIDSSQFDTSQKLNSLIVLVEENSDTTTQVQFVSYGSRLLKIIPVSDLNPGSKYQITYLSSIVSSQGRTMSANRNFVFQIGSTNVSQPTLLLPTNYSAVQVNPTLYWSTVTTSGSTGTLKYRVQISQNLTFSSLDWGTLTVATSAIPGVALEQSKTYFWRVRGEFYTSSPSSIGQWSDPFCFYQGTFLQPSPSTRQTYPSSISFELNDSSIENGESNLSSFPNLVFTFSSPIDSSTITSSTVYVERESVDGYPDSKKHSVSISTTIAGSSLTINISDALMSNTRYTLYIKNIKDINGNSFSTTKYWTSYYSPLYLGANVVRANFGEFLVDYPDDLINFHIFRISLDVNRHYLYFHNLWAGGPTESQVRNYSFTLTYPMERWVEVMSYTRLLNIRYYELLNSADSSRKLADYQEQTGSSLLRDLQSKIKGLQGEANEWFAQFSRHRARINSTRKSELWLPYRKYGDYSFADQIRREI